MYLNGRFPLVAVSGEALEMDDIVGRDEFSGGIDPVKQLIVRSENGLAVIWMQDLQAHRTEKSVTVDPGIAIPPEGAAHHEVLQEAEAIEVVVGFR